MAQVLRTDDVTEADRFAHWRHWISATFVPLGYQPKIACIAKAILFPSVVVGRAGQRGGAARARRAVGNGRAARLVAAAGRLPGTENHMTDTTYTGGTALLEAMREAGVRYAFANLGSDHTGFIEAYARAQREGSTGRFPELILCPHETVALSAAHGYAQVSGEPQAVLVHVDCGTQNLGGAVHNAARGRVPVLIFAGLSPVTQQGELPGSRTEFIHWLQDTADQRGLVRGYVKYDHEIRTPRNAKALVSRALQIARSEPARCT